MTYNVSKYPNHLNGSSDMTTPLRLPAPPRYILHQATPNRTLRMDVVTGRTHVLKANNQDTAEEELYWQRVRDDDGTEQQPTDDNE